MKNVHSVFAKSTLLRFESGGQSDHATGFFFRLESSGTDVSEYLITNKHVLGAVDADSLAIRVRNKGGMMKTERRDIPVYDNSGRPLWRTHTTADIAVLSLPFSLSETGNMAYEVDEIYDRTEDSAIDIPELSAIIVGYPDRFTDTNTYYPVLRNALISTPVGTNFEGEPRILTDAETHGGLSGSPVVAIGGRGGTLTMGLGEEGTPASYFEYQDPILLGVHSGKVDGRPLGDSELKLNNAWYADIIPEICQKFDTG